MPKPETIYVASTKDLRDAMSAGYALDQVAIPDLESEINKARTAGFDEGKAAGYAAGRNSRIASEVGTLEPDVLQTVRNAERDRVIGIQALTEQGFENIAKAAIDQGDGVETFALMMLRDKKDRGITMDAIRRDSPAPAPHARSPDDSGAAKALNDPARLNATEIFARRKGASTGTA